MKRSVAPRPRRRQAVRPHPVFPQGRTVSAPGLYVWENTAPDLAWARELATFARALESSTRR